MPSGWRREPPDPLGLLIISYERLWPIFLFVATDGENPLVGALISPRQLFPSVIVMGCTGIDR